MRLCGQNIWKYGWKKITWCFNRFRSCYRFLPCSPHNYLAREDFWHQGEQMACSLSPGLHCRFFFLCYSSDSPEPSRCSQAWCWASPLELQGRFCSSDGNVSSWRCPCHLLGACGRAASLDWKASFVHTCCTWTLKRTENLNLSKSKISHSDIPNYIISWWRSMWKSAYLFVHSFIYLSVHLCIYSGSICKWVDYIGCSWNFKISTTVSSSGSHHV